MSLDELAISNSDIVEKISGENGAIERLNQVYQGESTELQALKEDYLSKKEAYELALQNDENLQKEENKELTEKNVQLNNNIEASEKNIGDYEVKINNITNDIVNTENEINLLNTKLSALQISLNTLSSQTSDKPEKQTEISTQKKLVEEQLIIFDYNERNPLNAEARIILL